MPHPHPMIALRRGPLVESHHAGHAVICEAGGEIVETWGDPEAVIYPRSSCKMLQALPMVEAGLDPGPERLALACASHEGAPVHVAGVRRWLADLGLGEGDLLCGTEASRDRALRHEMIRAGEAPAQVHNNCSGKHTGFLALTRHLGAGPGYVAQDHPVQRAVRAGFEELTGEESPAVGIDGCSAPNFATSVHGLARAMAAFAGAREGEGARADAMARLRDAMIAHPLLVAGEGRACTELMGAAREPLALKTGAEAVYVAILPQRRLGVALKVVDGATRASEAAIAALLVRLGVLDADHPAVRKRLDAPVLNRAEVEVGRIEALPGFP